MIPSTLLIVLFVQWTSSWIDFTLILPHTYMMTVTVMMMMRMMRMIMRVVVVVNHHR